jgi:hypothetical protein
MVICTQNRIPVDVYTAPYKEVEEEELFYSYFLQKEGHNDRICVFASSPFMFS